MFNIPKTSIIIDCLGVRIGEQRGAERFICGIIAELALVTKPDYLLLINRSCLEFVRGLLPPSRYFLMPISGRNRIVRLLVQLILGPAIARRAEASLYISTSVFPTIGFPCPTSAVLHDLMLYHFPQEFNRAAWFFRTALLKASIPALSSVFTVSETSAQDIRSRFGQHVRSLHVVPNGANASAATFLSSERQDAIVRDLGLKNRKFVLSVLGGGTYKNQRGLADAAQRLMEMGRDDIDVIVVGDALRVYRTISYPKSLRPLGFVSDEILGVLYANAVALVCPTLFEGFGIPVIEAQAAGLPVVCSDIPVLREVGGKAAVYVDPHRADSIATGILKVVDSPELREHLICEGKENAARFTWRRATERFLEACDAVIAEPTSEGSAMAPV